MGGAGAGCGGAVDPGFVQKVSKAGRRPRVRAEWPPPLAALLTRCWDPEPSRRPEFAHVVEVLGGLLAPAPTSRGAAGAPALSSLLRRFSALGRGRAAAPR